MTEPYSYPSPTEAIEQADLIARAREVEAARYTTVFDCLSDPDCYRRQGGRLIPNYAAISRRTGRTVHRIKSTMGHLSECDRKYNPRIIETMLGDPSAFFSGSSRLKPQAIANVCGVLIPVIYEILAMTRGELPDEKQEARPESRSGATRRDRKRHTSR